MKALKIRVTFCLLILSAIFLTFSSQAQQRPAHHKDKTMRTHNNKRVVVKHSAYRPNKVIVYHPKWGSRNAYYNRWIFFPHFNFYWDNWRGQYVYRSNNSWVSSIAAPAFVVNINLEKEKQYELRENNDDNDDIYYNNDEHLKVYKEE